MSSLRVLCYLFFFFKQKTAYEMRISDWSSDVCSSDLVADAGRGGRLRHRGGGRALREGRRGDDRNEREREHDQNEPAEREPAATHLTADARLAEQHRRVGAQTAEHGLAHWAPRSIRVTPPRPTDPSRLRPPTPHHGSLTPGEPTRVSFYASRRWGG